MMDRNCPKHEEFYSKNNLEKLVHLVINQLDAQNFLFYIKIILCLYMFRAHVLETCTGIK